MAQAKKKDGEPPSENFADLYHAVNDVGLASFGKEKFFGLCPSMCGAAALLRELLQNHRGYAAVRRRSLRKIR